MKLPAELTENFTFKISEITRITHLYLEEELKAVGLTRAQWLFLSNLHFVEGCNQQDLSTLMDIGKVALGKVAIRLEQKGWIERRSSNEDGRSVSLYIRDKARPLVRTLVELFFEETKRSLAGLSDEDVANLNYYLSKIRQNVVTQSGSEKWKKLKNKLEKNYRILPLS